MKLSNFPELQNLSIEEKLQLIDELWLAIGKENETEAISEEEKKMLDERWAQFERNPNSALTMEEIKAKLTARLAK